MFSLLVGREVARAFLEYHAKMASMVMLLAVREEFEVFYQAELSSILAATEQVRAFLEYRAKAASMVMLLAVREQVEAFGQAEVASILALLAARKRVGALSELKAEVASLVAQLAAFELVGASLEEKSKVSLSELDEYIEAISNGPEVTRNMAYMAAGWAVLGGLSMIL
jgi:hypothetical protein